MKVKHLKLKQVAQDLYLCTDRRSSPEPKLEGSSGGAGYVYLGFENKVLQYQKREERRNRYIKKKSAEQSTSQAIRAPIGTGSSER